MLALDYALRPVLQALSARHILPGVYATDSQIPKANKQANNEADSKAYSVGPETAGRLDDAVANLMLEGFRVSATSGFEPVHFSLVRCSV